MPREIGQHGLALLHPTGRIGLAEHRMVTGLVRHWEEDEGAGLANAPLSPCERPAGDDARERGDICLGVAAVNAERVQLQDFASKVLVEPPPASLTRGRLRPEGLSVIEVEEHRWMAFDGF